MSRRLHPIPDDHWIRRTPFIVLDLETTGLDADRDRIVQIGLLRVDGGDVRDEWATLVDPGVPIPRVASQVHGIDEARIRDGNALPFLMLAEDLLARARGRQMVGYNAARFDAPLLRKELARVGLATGGRTPLDPLIWVRHIDPYVRGHGRHALDTSARRHGVTWEGDAHEAVVDCRITWGLMVRLVELRPDLFAGSLAEVLERQTALAAEQDRAFEAWKQAQQDKAVRS